MQKTVGNETTTNKNVKLNAFLQAHFMTGQKQHQNVDE